MQSKIEEIAEQCTGCCACESVCPVNCISMCRDKLGFLYPQIDYGNCIDCKLCERTCPALSDTSRNEIKNVYKAHSRDIELRRKSTSGGIFGELCREIIANKGVVYGVVFDKDFCSVHHERADVQKDIEHFYGSKYIQSDMRESFAKVEQDLKYGRMVLFSGTPCQVAGLKKYLRQDYTNLLTCDFICHGVGAPWIYKQYIDLIKEKFAGDTIRMVKFRSKVKSYSESQFEVEFESGKHYRENFDSENYGFLYANNIVSRTSCSVCKYANVYRASDITIADYVGNDKTLEEAKEGVSLVFVNTDKGIETIEKISACLSVIEQDMEEVRRRCMHLNAPPQASPMRQKIYKLICNHGFKGAIKKAKKYCYIKEKWNACLIVRGVRKLKRILTNV